MLGSRGISQTELGELAEKIADLVVRRTSRASASPFGADLKTNGLEESIKSLTSALELHLQIAKVRVGLEESTLGASELLIRTLTSISSEASKNRLTEEIGRRADSLIKALKTAESRGLLDQLCECAVRGLVPQAKKEEPKKFSFGS